MRAAEVVLVGCSDEVAKGIRGVRWSAADFRRRRIRGAFVIVIGVDVVANGDPHDVRRRLATYGARPVSTVPTLQIGPRSLGV